VQQELRKFIFENFMFGTEDVQLSPDDSLVEKGLIDSTGVLELIAFIEKRYGIRIEDEEVIPENLDSINLLTRFIEKKMLVRAQPCN
jgi:acyl carrier protein